MAANRLGISYDPTYRDFGCRKLETRKAGRPFSCQSTTLWEAKLGPNGGRHWRSETFENRLGNSVQVSESVSVPNFGLKLEMAEAADEGEPMSQSSDSSSGSSDADAYQAIIRDYVSEESILLHEETMFQIEASRTRRVYNRPLPEQSAFAVWMHSHRQYLGEPSNRAHVTFRRRFRVTYARFQYLYRETTAACDENGNLLFKPLPVDAVGRVGISLEVKLMGALRVLGRASCFDSIAELSNCDG